jgi:hypothetical protein
MDIGTVGELVSWLFVADSQSLNRQARKITKNSTKLEFDFKLR